MDWSPSEAQRRAARTAYAFELYPKLTVRMLITAILEEASRSTLFVIALLNKKRAKLRP